MSSSPRTWSYGRAFFLTIGLMMRALMTMAWSTRAHGWSEWPASARLFFGGMIFTGFLVCYASLGSGDQALKKWVDAIGVHEGALLIAIIATPVYWIGELFQKPRRKR